MGYSEAEFWYDSPGQVGTCHQRQGIRCGSGLATGLRNLWQMVWCTDFYHPGDEGGLAWNDPVIGIEWPEVVGAYQGTASAEGYMLQDGTKLVMSEKDQLWSGMK